MGVKLKKRFKFTHSDQLTTPMHASEKQKREQARPILIVLLSTDSLREDDRK